MAPLKPLRIENGQFMRGDSIVKPEIGNRDQIELLQAYERARQDALKDACDEGIRCDFSAMDFIYTSNIRMVCVCGEMIAGEKPGCMADQSDDLEWLDENWDDEIITCRHCRRRYKVQGGRAKIIPE